MAQQVDSENAITLQWNHENHDHTFITFDHKDQLSIQFANLNIFEKFVIV